MKYMSVAEAAKKWGVTPRQVRNYCAKERLDTCRAAQDIFIAGLRKFGHAKIAEKALAEQAKSEGEMKEVRSE